MKLDLQRPLVFFDLETTGLDTKFARIVEIAMIRLLPDQTTDSFLTLVNPEMTIPTDATNVHGINNFDVLDKPTFKEIAVDVVSIIKDCDLAGYNLASYDVPILVNELERAGIFYSIENTKIIDVLTIFKQKERRDLSAAYRFYCKKELKDAHSALKDTQATLEIFKAQTERYADLPQDIEGLHKFCNQREKRFVDKDKKFKWIKDEASFTFGKYRGQPLSKVVKKDAEYLEWMATQDFSDEVRNIIRSALKGQFPEKQKNNLNN
jgi:DNA polymerase III subunit epsilon